MKLIRVFFVLLFVFIGSYIFAGTVEVLSSLLVNASDHGVKKHLQSALYYAKKGMVKSVTEEIFVLKKIDPVNSAAYDEALDSGNEKIEPSDSTKTSSALVLTPEISPAVSSRLVRAKKLYSESDLAGCRSELDEIILLAPENKEALSLADELKAQKFIPSKNRLYQELVASLYEEAMASYRAGKYSEAAVKFKKAADTDPECEIVKNYSQKNREALMNNGGVPSEGMIGKAEKLKNLGSYSEARKILEKILLEDPGNKQAAYYINELNGKSVMLCSESSALFDKNELQKALLKSKDAVDCDPSNTVSAQLYSAVSAAYETQKSGADLKKKINRYYNKGVTYFGNAEYEKAIAQWRKVLELAPNDADAERNIKAAEEKLSESTEEKDKATRERLKKAKALLDQGMLDEAQSAYQYVIRLDKSNTVAANGLLKITELRDEADKTNVRRR